MQTLKNNRGSVAVEFIITSIIMTMALAVLIHFILHSISGEAHSFKNYMRGRNHRITITLPPPEADEDNPINQF